GSTRRNSAVPATSLTALLGSAGAYTVVSGYSAAQANHFTCTLSTHSSVYPFNSPSTARPATSQREPVSWSTNGAAGTRPSGLRVTAFFGPSGSGSAGDSPSALGRGAAY